MIELLAKNCGQCGGFDFSDKEILGLLADEHASVFDLFPRVIAV
jgi:hypothetical protein